ncbi:MAG: hydroxymethylbilane synthase [Phycisphaerae bacterium]|nr:hydroxymethylbilane synthase [Phycisphaerae bacterium]
MATHNRTGLVIGSRGSMLAVTQTNWVAKALRDHYPALDVSIKLMTTRGDRSQASEVPMAAVGGKGLFTAELEDGLRDGSIDLAVHSAKDLPGELAAGTDILAWPKREDPRDALIAGPDSLAPSSLAAIPLGATFGTSSLRRVGQLKSLRPDLNVQPIRGNIETRIRKVREGQFAATLLAVAGLRRTGLLHEAAQILSVEQMTPAAGQAALALQGRAGDERVAKLLSVMDDTPTRRAVLAERRVVARLAGGCNMPLGVYVEDRAGRLVGRAVLVSPTGELRVDAAAEGADPITVGDALADELLAKGGAKLLDVSAPPSGA